MQAVAEQSYHRHAFFIVCNLATTDTLFAWTIINESAASAFCEYGGTQTHPDNDMKPVDMPPMLPKTIGGI